MNTSFVMLITSRTRTPPREATCHRMATKNSAIRPRACSQKVQQRGKSSSLVSGYQTDQAQIQGSSTSSEKSRDEATFANNLRTVIDNKTMRTSLLPDAFFPA